MDAAGGPAHVQRLAGVLLHVDALDAHPDQLRLAGPVLVLDRDVEPAVGAQRLVVLGDLEVLGHVRVEVVLPREPAPLGDRAVQRQPDLDRVLDRGPGRHRQRPGQAQAGRAGLGVGLAAEGGRAAAEQLGPGAQLDVGLQADGRLVARHRLGVGHECGRGHRPAPFVMSLAALARLARPGGIGQQRVAPALGERGLGRGGHPVGPVVGQHRRHDLQADRQVVLRGQAARHRQGGVAGQVGRDRGQVGQVHGHRVVGPLTDLERGGRRGRRDQHVGLAERRLEVAGDQRPDLLGLAVVGVVVPAGQGVGAEHDAPLDLGPETGLAGQRHHLFRAAVAVVTDPQPVPHGVEPGQVGGGTRSARSGSRRAARS